MSLWNLNFYVPVKPPKNENKETCLSYEYELLKMLENNEIEFVILMRKRVDMNNIVLTILLDFESSRRFMGEGSLENHIQYYSIFSGLPYYLSLIDPLESLENNIKIYIWIVKILSDFDVINE